VVSARRVFGLSFDGTYPTSAPAAQPRTRGTLQRVIGHEKQHMCELLLPADLADRTSLWWQVIIKLWSPLTRSAPRP